MVRRADGTRIHADASQLHGDPLPRKPGEPDAQDVVVARTRPGGKLGRRHTPYGPAVPYQATVAPQAILAYLERRGQAGPWWSTRGTHEHRVLGGHNRPWVRACIAPECARSARKNQPGAGVLLLLGDKPTNTADKSAVHNACLCGRVRRPGHRGSRRETPDEYADLGVNASVKSDNLTTDRLRSARAGRLISNGGTQ